VTAKASTDAAILHCGRNGTEKARPLGSEIIDVLIMHECLRKIQSLEVELKETTKKQKDSVRQLYEAKAHITKKEKEVCDLQSQSLQDRTEKQRLFHEVRKRDNTILCLQKSCANLKSLQDQTEKHKVVGETMKRDKFSASLKSLQDQTEKHKFVGETIKRDKFRASLKSLKDQTERQRLLHEYMKRDKAILCPHNSYASLNTQASDGDVKHSAWSLAAESHSGLNVRSPKLAGTVGVMSATNLHANPFPKACHSSSACIPSACGPILPTLPRRALMFSPSTNTNFRMAEPAPLAKRTLERHELANCVTGVSPRQKFKLLARETPAQLVVPWVQLHVEAIAGDAVADANQVMQNLQLRTPRCHAPKMQAKGMPTPVAA